MASAEFVAGPVSKQGDQRSGEDNSPGHDITPLAFIPCQQGPTRSGMLIVAHPMTPRLPSPLDNRRGTSGIPESRSDPHVHRGLPDADCLGGPPPLEVGEAMIVADSITIFVGSAVRTKWAGKPSVCHRLPHVQRTWGHPAKRQASAKVAWGFGRDTGVRSDFVVWQTPEP